MKTVYYTQRNKNSPTADKAYDAVIETNNVLVISIIKNFEENEETHV